MGSGDTVTGTVGRAGRMDCLVVLIVVIASFASTVTSHKCYVCAPDSGKVEDIEQLKKYFPDTAIPACSHYKPHLKDQYLLECPPALSKGCLTKFEDTHGVTRTCARLAIDDCPIANSIQYCYCKKEGCNNPDSTLAAVLPGPEKLADTEGKSAGLGSASAGHSPPVFASQFPAGGQFSDDEDEAEGSADWGDFYYDEYNYGEENYSGIRLDNGPDTGLGLHHQSGPSDDTEGGEEDYLNEDVTNPPPYLDLGEEHGKHSFWPDKEETDRVNPKFEWETTVRENDEIKFVEEEEEEGNRGKQRDSGTNRGRTGSGSIVPSSSYSLLLLLLLLSSCHPRTYRSL